MMNEEMLKKWDYVLYEFKLDYPTLYDKIIDWYPCGQDEFIIRLNDDTKRRYNALEHVAYVVYDPDDNELEDELEWREMFSSRLRAKMHNLSMSQEMLSMETGISQVSISKYLHNKATPSGYTIRKLARALRCSSVELTEYRIN